MIKIFAEVVNGLIMIHNQGGVGVEWGICSNPQLINFVLTPEPVMILI